MGHARGLAHATIRAVGAEQLDRRRQRPRRPAKAWRMTGEQEAWIRRRTRIGWALDDLLRTRPSDELRRTVRLLEEALAAGDHAVGLL